MIYKVTMILLKHRATSTFIPGRTSMVQVIHVGYCCCLNKKRDDKTNVATVSRNLSLRWHALFGRRS